MAKQQGIQSSVQSTNLADLLERILDKGIVIAGDIKIRLVEVERILDKGIVIAGDIKIRLVEVELLTLQIRLVICSVDKAKELGIDWWVANPAFNSQAPSEELAASLNKIDARLGRLESAMAVVGP